MCASTPCKARETKTAVLLLSARRATDSQGARENSPAQSQCKDGSKGGLET